MDVSNIQFSSAQNIYRKQTNTSPSVSKGNDHPEEQDALQVQAEIGIETLASITKEEKNFFGELFPNSANEIQSYQSYNEQGLKASATVGTLIDRKG